MGAWGTGLYSGDFAVDLRNTIAAVTRLPLDEEKLVEAIVGTETSAATQTADEDHTVFWLVLADQFERRGIFSRRVRDKALAIIDGGEDAAMMRTLGMKAGDIAKRSTKLAELRARIAVQSEVSHPRKTLKAPEPYVFDLYGAYAYPTHAGQPINPYVTPKHFNRAEWRADGFGVTLIVGRGRAFEFLAWYRAVRAAGPIAAIPTRDMLRDLRWVAPPIYGTCNRAHFRKMELVELDTFSLDPERISHFFPHLAPGTSYAISDISIANRMETTRREVRRRWRRPDGKLELIVYPPPPTIADLQ
jgi:hypothetical protein